MAESTTFLNAVLKIEDTTGEPHNIRGIYSKCGETPHLYHYPTGIPGDPNYYFLRFSTAAIAQRALLITPPVPGIRAQLIAHLPHIVEQYRATNHADFDPRTRRVPPQCQCEFMSPGLGIIPTCTQQNYSAILETAICAKTKDIALHDNKEQLHKMTKIPLSPSQTLKLNQELPQVTLCLCGVSLGYALSPDPQPLLELLALAEGDLGSYMLVGASYRRLGNSHAALEVGRALIEDIQSRSNKSKPSTLHPAYLLLAGSEFDLAKCADTPSEAATHRLNAQRWLQKVYGRDAAERLSQSDLARRDKVQAIVSELTSLRAQYTDMERHFRHERELRRRAERRLDDLLRTRPSTGNEEFYEKKRCRESEYLGSRKREKTNTERDGLRNCGQEKQRVLLEDLANLKLEVDGARK